MTTFRKLTAHFILDDVGSVLEDVDQDLSNINENMTPEPRKSFMCNGILNSEDKKGF